jgi:hypothetical protein
MLLFIIHNFFNKKLDRWPAAMQPARLPKFRAEFFI